MLRRNLGPFFFFLIVCRYFPGGLLYYAGGLKLDLSYIQYTAELVWDLSRGLIEVNFNGGIVDKLVKSKR